MYTGMVSGLLAYNYVETWMETFVSGLVYGFWGLRILGVCLRALLSFGLLGMNAKIT